MAGFKTRMAAAFVATVMAIAAPFVAQREGEIFKTYLDPVGIPTICVGHTGPDVALGQTATQAQCAAWLREDLNKAYASVERCIHVQLTPSQAAALTSFAFNVGGARLCDSTLARMANTGQPAAIWCAQLDRWVYSDGRVFAGLVKRRAAEREMCEGKILPFPARPPARASSPAPAARRAA